MQQNPNYTNLRVMLDGGVAGQSGDTFQGGGFLSSILNSPGGKG